MQLQWPILNIGKGPISISQWFGPTSFGDYGQFGLIGHNGIDIACPRGTPIHASHDGYIVEATEKTGGFGIRVTQVFEEDGFLWQITYGHLKSYVGPEMSYSLWSRSKFVKQGDVIGYVNSTGYSFGDHLHFTLYKLKLNGTYVNKNNGYGGAIDQKPFLPTKFPTEEEGDNMSQVKIAVIHGEGGIFLATSSIPQLVEIGKIFGKEVKLAEDGMTVLNPDILVTP